MLSYRQFLRIKLMQITVNIPDNVKERLEQKLDNLPYQILLGFALNAYQNKIISTYELGQILGLESIFETHKFLKQSGVYLNYDEEEMLKDIDTIERSKS